MSRKQFWKTTSASMALLGMFGNTVAATEPTYTLATSTGTTGSLYAVPPSQEAALTPNQKLTLIKQKIKYVFVLFQENRSFDTYFGTYPGANGLVSTYPGADPGDAMAKPANQTASYVQNIRNTDGSYSTISPFLAPRTILNVNGDTVQLYPESFYSVDHSHSGYMADFHLNYSGSRTYTKNDAYALDQEGLQYSSDGNAPNSSSTSYVITKSSTGLPTGSAPTSYPSLASKQKGEDALAHHDCDTIPFLWHYADVGMLFDNMHQTITGPSTPNAIALISGQSGATQWVKHPSEAGSLAIPNETDTGPFAGSTSDSFSGAPPYGPDEETFATCATNSATAGYKNNLSCPVPATSDPAYASYSNKAVVALDGTVSGEYPAQTTLTYASLPLSFMGSHIATITAQDAYPTTDLADIQNDITAIHNANPAVAWGWYQQGFGPEPYDSLGSFGTTPHVTDSFPAATPHASYIVHHNGPQYFGYLGDNPLEVANMHGLHQFYTDVANHNLPAKGGVFYVRGGYYNQDGLETADPSAAVRTTFSGNDDHGSYSDSQISEALIADSVNAIANSSYWSQSAILIIWDESDGFYDHVPELIRSFGPDGLPLSGGPRIPAIVISPYATAHSVSHVYSEHSSAIRAIDGIFDLVPLASLPDEAAAQAAAAASNSTFLTPSGKPQKYLGPADNSTNDIIVGDMIEALDNNRLLGTKALIPASAVTIPAATAHSLPHYSGAGCTTLGITPTDYPNGYGVGMESDPPPADFNPRPTVSPGNPYEDETIIGGVMTTPWTP